MTSIEVYIKKLGKLEAKIKEEKQLLETYKRDWTKETTKEIEEILYGCYNDQRNYVSGLEAALRIFGVGEINVSEK